MVEKLSHFNVKMLSRQGQDTGRKFNLIMNKSPVGTK